MSGLPKNTMGSVKEEAIEDIKEQRDRFKRALLQIADGPIPPLVRRLAREALDPGEEQ